MASVLKKALDLLVGTEPLGAEGVSSSAASVLPVRPTKKPTKMHKRPFRKLTERELIQLESDIGAQLFGGVPKGHRREFFNLDLSTWIWYDEWTDSLTGERKAMTIRYEVHENGILKVQEGARYNFIEGQELDNFMAAIHMYYERVARELYQTDPGSYRARKTHAI